MFVCAFAVARRPDKSSLDSPQQQQQQQHTLQQTHAHRNDPFPQRPKQHSTTKCTMRTAMCVHVVCLCLCCMIVYIYKRKRSRTRRQLGDLGISARQSAHTCTNVYALLYALAQPKRPLHIRINSQSDTHSQIYIYIYTHRYTQTSSNSSSVAEQAWLALALWSLIKSIVRNIQTQTRLAAASLLRGSVRALVLLSSGIDLAYPAEQKSRI